MKKILTPYKRIKNNLLMTKTGKCWAYFQLPPVTISENNQEKIDEYKTQLEKVYDLIGEYPEFSSQILPTDYRLEEKMDALTQDFSDGTEYGEYDPKYDYRALGKTYIKRANETLKEELGQLTEYTMYLAIRLKSKVSFEDEKVKENLKSGAKLAKHQIMSVMNWETKTTEEDFKQYQAIEEDLYNSLQVISIERVTEERLNFLHEFSFHHNIVSSEDFSSKDCVIDPTEKAGYLKVQLEDEEYYLSTLPIAKTPDLLNHIEFFKIAQSFTFPVEFFINGRTMNKTLAKNKINLISNRFKETDKAMYQNEDTDDEIVLGKTRLNDLRNAVKNENKHVFEWMGAFVVVGKTLAETKRKVREVKNTMKQNYSVVVVQPLVDQLYLFYKFLQGQSLDMSEPYWLQWTTHRELAEFSLGMTKQLGSYVGWYLGRISEGKSLSHEEAVASSRHLVLFHSFLAHEGVKGAVTDSPHIGIFGQIGKGKSYTVKYLFFCSQFMKGRILMTDPKSEFRERLEFACRDERVQANFPEFVEMVNRIKFITLNPDKSENEGVLDPLNFLTGSTASATILDIFSSITSLDNRKCENELRRCVETVLQLKESQQEVGLMHVVERLKANEDEEISLFGENIEMKVKNSILKLVFGYGTSNGVSVKDKVTILQIEGLDLPDSKTPLNEQSESEQKSIAVMIALAKFCQDFGKRDKHEKTTTIFDEAWTLTTAKGGKKLLKELRRVGRSYANQLILVTQSVKDIDTEEDNGNFGACFFFDEPSEREEILKTAGLPITKENIEWLASLKKGQCLFRDYYGRIDVISVDCLFPEWDLGFKTTDNSHAKIAEQAFSR